MRQFVVVGLVSMAAAQSTMDPNDCWVVDRYDETSSSMFPSKCQTCKGTAILGNPSTHDANTCDDSHSFVGTDNPFPCWTTMENCILGWGETWYSDPRSPYSGDVNWYNDVTIASGGTPTTPNVVKAATSGGDCWTQWYAPGSSLLSMCTHCTAGSAGVAAGTNPGTHKDVNSGVTEYGCLMTNNGIYGCYSDLDSCCADAYWYEESGTEFYQNPSWYSACMAKSGGTPHGYTPSTPTSSPATTAYNGPATTQAAPTRSGPNDACYVMSEIIDPTTGYPTNGACGLCWGRQVTKSGQQYCSTTQGSIPCYISNEACCANPAWYNGQGPYSLDQNYYSDCLATTNDPNTQFTH